MRMKMEKFVEKFVVFVFLAHVSQHASGVEVYNGEESVLLPCRFPAPLSSDSVIVWRRDDLNPVFVHTFVDGRDQLGSQNPRYNERTSIHQNPLQTGDLSLTLTKPTFTDSGNYTCAIRRAGRDQVTTAVHLVVKEPSPPDWPKYVIGFGVPVLLLLFGFSLFFMYRVNERQKRTAVNQLKAVEVKEGADSVLLSFKTKRTLPEVSKVEWMFVKDDDRTICVYENGQIKEHPDYKDRIEMKNQQLSQTKVSFTLTLKKPRLTDGGVYTCSIYDKDGRTLKQKVVALWVKERRSKTFKAALLNRHQSTLSTSSVSLDLQDQIDEEAHELKDNPV